MAEQLAPGAIFGRDFRVVQRIAAGGMGTVYEAVQLSTGKKRALKIMHAQYEGDDRTRLRFIQEAQATAAVESDHIVEMVAAGVEEESNTPWIAMELLQGRDMKAALAERGTFTRAEVAEMFRQLCHGLGGAHREGLVHRDLKPENIFLADPRREGIPFTVKLLDFGLAKLVQESSTQGSATQAVGSPRWMAPEQAGLSGQIAPETDVWALGLIAFNLLTGKVYWRIANSPSSTIMQQLTEVLMQPLDPASVRAAEYGVGHLLPARFDSWFARCVVRDASQRFHDANEALAELLPILDSYSLRPMRATTRPPVSINLDADIPRDETPFTLDGDTSGGPYDPSHPPKPASSRLMGQVGYVLVGALVSATAVFAIAMGLRKSAPPLPPGLPNAVSTVDVPGALGADAPVAVAVAVATDLADASAAMVFAPAETVEDSGAVAARPVAPPVAPPVAAPVAPVVPRATPTASAPAARVDAGEAPGANLSSLQDRLEAQLRERSVDVQACYERGSESNPGLAGRLTIFYSVTPDGRATEVSTRGLAEAPAVGECVGNLVRAMTFRAPPPTPMTLIYQWSFRPHGPVPTTAPPAETPPAAPPNPPAAAPAEREPAPSPAPGP
ncbi:MAG: protein kinase [Deltaproteobacteria bacterium]|nr:protein kinase [Myxococcales bacterium]MDP3214731.1 protein kinase [Deltaproteobacteria bacterium]